MACDTWGEDLRRHVTAALRQLKPPSELVTACLNAASCADPARDEDVRLVVEQLGALGWQLYRAGDRRCVVVLSAAADTARESYVATKSALFILELARLMSRYGLASTAVDYLGDSRSGMVGVQLARVQNLRGELLRQLGRLGDAEDELDNARATLTTAGSPDPGLLATVLNNLGIVHRDAGDLLGARKHLNEAMRLRAQASLPDDPVTIDNLGIIEVGLAKLAGPLYLGEGKYINATVSRHLDQAEHYLDRACKLFEAGLPDSADDLTVCLLNKAEVAKRWRDVKRLEELSDEAMELADTYALTNDTALHVVALRVEWCLETDHLVDAVSLLLPRLEQLARMEPARRPGPVLVAFLRAAGRSGGTELVRTVAQLLAERDNVVIARKLTTVSSEQARQVFTSHEHHLQLILGHCLPAEPAGTCPPWLYELVLNRKGVLAERQGRLWLASGLHEGADPTLLDEVRTLRAEAARADLDGTSDSTITAARWRHDEAMTQLGEAERALYRSLPPERSQLRWVTVSDVRSRIEADSALLDFAVMLRPDDEQLRYVMFTVAREGPVRYADVGAADSVDDKLRAVIGLLQTPPDSDADRLERAVHACPALFDAEDALPRNLVVAPTRMWGMAPLGLLPDTTGTPLIDSHVVNLVPSGRWLATVQPGEGEGVAAPGPPVVLGDPDFDVYLPGDLPFLMSLRFSRLKHAKEETAKVAELLGVTPVADAAATRERLLELQGPEVLHIASHGQFLSAINSFAEQREPRAMVMSAVGGTVVVEDLDPRTAFGGPPGGGSTGDESHQPRDVHRARVRWLREIGPSWQLSRSAVLLAGFNAWLAGQPLPDNIGTGMVTAAELAMLDLAGTSLVVLSACETGIGAIDFADGSLLGLRTATLAAGARCSVSSLWKVQDSATAELMAALHSSGAAGYGAALREAQLHVRANRPDPYYWAGWIAEGLA